MIRPFYVYILCAVGSAAGPIHFQADSEGFIGSKACATCHAEVAAKYATTAMAQASGHASALQLPGGNVAVPAIASNYTVRSEGGIPILQFQRNLPDGTSVQGAKTFSYYVGSGAHGRGFIFQEQGQPFQSPVAYYGPARGWDLAPGYEGEHKLFLSRKVEPGCLNCHASGINRTTSELFTEGAVSCERCHGPGESHVAAVQAGKGHSSAQIINPAKLDSESRDSVCAQCHLTGESRILKPGKSETSFRAGDRLTQHLVPFIRATPHQAELKVVGHFEGLWQSKCKRVSGDKLSCLTCHDPHTRVSEANKAAYYKEKCLTCHAEAACKAPVALRAAKAGSCIACHMQTRASTDGQHTAFTDHAIRRDDSGWQSKQPQTNTSAELVPFWPNSATERDYALAYADESWLSQTTQSLLRSHEKLSAVWARSPGDPAVAAQLAYSWDLAGDPKQAEALYRQALKDDPENILALTNMGTHLARSGDTLAAAALWRKALAINPGLFAPGLNLAHVEDSMGHTSEALETIRKVLSLNPDSDVALKLERDLNAAKK